MRGRLCRSRSGRKDNIPSGAIPVHQQAGQCFKVKGGAVLPLCHPLSISGVEVEFALDGAEVECRVTVSATYRTGVEMEALTGVMAGLLCVWDLVKPLEKDEAGQYPDTRIHTVEVVEKRKEE